MNVIVFGHGVPFSGVTKRFNGERCRVTWADPESDDQWIKVHLSEDTEYSVHACQCFPAPKKWVSLE